MTYNAQKNTLSGKLRLITGGIAILLLTSGMTAWAQQSDTLATRQQEQAQEGQVDFQASDSLVFDFRTDRKATLYGSAKVVHRSGDLSAGTITMNIDSQLVSASTPTPEDTLSQPVLTRDGETIRSNRIKFNYETQKGRFEVARVRIEQGKVTGTTVKNTSRNTVFLEDAIYSTCTLDHPHYYIKANRMKVVDQDEIFFTNARLYLLDIPYPLVFPFGYLPAKIQRRQSGLLEPTYSYQQKRTRGIGVQNLGWFQYFSDYLTGRASVDIFTSGTFYLNTRTDYAKRNKFNGNITIGYSRERGLESTDPDFSINTQKRLNIVHSQNFSPYASMSANIDLKTADYFRRNSFNPNERVETSTSSNLSYRYRHPENLYNFSISARQNRNFRTNTTRLSGPNMNFSLKNISPFASGGQTQDAAWYENISLRYQNTFQSDYNFDPTRDDSARVNWFEALFDPGKYREATNRDRHYQYGFRQQADLTFGQLIPSRHVNLSARANYNEYWFPTTTHKTFNADSNRVEEQQVRGFTTARDFSTGLNLSTTIYGISSTKIGSIEGFRHTMRPSISFGYRPDFSDEYWGYFKEVQVDTSGNTQKYSIFENEIFRGPSSGEQRSVGINISNVFEAKQVRRDSTGEKNENTLRLVDQLDFSTSYNFAADSIRLNDLSATFSSRAVEGLNIRANARFNFYERDSTGTKTGRFLAATPGRVAEMTTFSINASTTFRGGGSEGIQIDNTPYYPATYDPLNQSIFSAMDTRFNEQPVQPVNSQWSFSLNFRYSWRLNPGRESTTSASINAENIQFNLTPKWSVRTQLGYDFIQKNISYSQFSLQRDLHCWSLSFTMNPFGDAQYYFFKLSVNSGQIQSILQKLPLLNNLERSSSPTGRSPVGY